MNTTPTRDWQHKEDVDLLTQLAIDAALSSDWQEAAKINQKILTITQDDVEALNRLARAQTCAGSIDKAQKTYKKVLELDPYNIIAKKNFEKIAKLPPTKAISANGHSSETTNGYTNGHSTNLASIFLCEPGKTKTINLLNLASPSILATLNCGQKVAIIPKKHSIVISDESNSYLGALPDDISHKLLFYITGGNKYEAYIKFATTKSLAIFIKEIERSARFANQPSFQDTYPLASKED